MLPRQPSCSTSVLSLLTCSAGVPGFMTMIMASPFNKKRGSASLHAVRYPDFSLVVRLFFSSQTAGAIKAPASKIKEVVRTDRVGVYHNRPSLTKVDVVIIDSRDAPVNRQDAKSNPSRAGAS